MVLSNTILTEEEQEVLKSFVSSNSREMQVLRKLMTGYVDELKDATKVDTSKGVQDVGEQICARLAAHGTLTSILQELRAQDRRPGVKRSLSFH